MISVSTQLSEQLTFVRATGQLRKSSEVMKCVSSLVKVPTLLRSLKGMSKEMYKAGLIDEMVGDHLDGMLDDADTEELAEEEVNRILDELSVAVTMPSAPVRRAQVVQKEAVDEEEEEDAEREELARRLAAIKT